MHGIKREGIMASSMCCFEVPKIMRRDLLCLTVATSTNFFTASYPADNGSHPCTCVYMCLCVLLCVFAYIYSCECVCVCLCMSLSVCVLCVCVFAYVGLCVRVCICLFVHVFVRVFVCAHAYNNCVFAVASFMT